MSEKGKRLSPAQRRALLTAHQCGVVRKAGGYSGNSTSKPTELEGFDRACVVDRLVALRLLAPGEYANTFVPTSLGNRRVAAMRQRGEASA